MSQNFADQSRWRAFGPRNGGSGNGFGAVGVKGLMIRRKCFSCYSDILCVIKMTQINKQRKQPTHRSDSKNITSDDFINDPLDSIQLNIQWSSVIKFLYFYIFD
jgi:hypothetical protein